MGLRRAAANLITILGLAACASPTSRPPPTPTLAATESVITPTVTTTGAPTATLAATLAAPIVDAAYTSLDVPLTQRAESSQAGLDSVGPESFVLHTGEFRLELSSGPNLALRLSREGALAALALQPLGPELNVLSQVERIVSTGDAERPGLLFAGGNGWMRYQLWVWVYPHNPGLLHYHLEMTRLGDLPAGATEPEWTFVMRAAGHVGYAGTACLWSSLLYCCR